MVSLLFTSSPPRRPNQSRPGDPNSAFRMHVASHIRPQHPRSFHSLRSLCSLALLSMAPLGGRSRPTHTPPPSPTPGIRRRHREEQGGGGGGGGRDGDAILMRLSAGISGITLIRIRIHFHPLLFGSIAGRGRGRRKREGDPRVPWILDPV